MGGAGEVLLVSILIRAIDGASGILRALGISGAAGLNPLVVGAAVVGAAIGGIGIMAAKAATDFDYNMQKIAALTDTSAAQMQWYKQQLLAMAPALDQTPTALAQGLYFVISAGYSGADALKILALSAQAAASTMTPMMTVADLLTTAMNSYRSSNLSAGHAMDDLIKLVVNGKVTMKSLGTSFGFVAVQGAAAGFSFDELSAAVSALSQIAGEHGSRRVMMDLGNLIRQLGMRDITTTLKSMKSMHIELNLGQYATASLVDKIKMLAQASGLTMESLDAMRKQAHGNAQEFERLALTHMKNSAAFLKLIGGAAAALPAFMLLEDNGKSYNTILKQMGGNGQATANAFDTMRQSTQQQMNMLKVAGVSILTVLGEQLLPTLNRLLGFFYRLAQGILKFVGTSAGIQAIKVALLGIAAVVGGILLTTIGGLIVSAAPLILIIAGIVAGGILLGKIIQAVVAHFGGWNKILKDIQPILTVVKNLFAQAGTAIKKAIADPAIQAAWKQLQAALPQLLPVLKVIAIVVGVTLFVAFKAIVGVILLVIKILPILINIVAFVITVLGKIAQFILDLFSGKVVRGIGNALGHLGALIGARFSEFGTTIHLHLMAIVVRVGAFFSELGSKVHDGLEAVKHIFQAALAWIGNLFKWLYNHNYYFQWLVDHIRLAFTRARQFITQIWNGIKNFLRAAWSDIQSAASRAWQAVYQHIIEPVQQAWTFVTGKIGALVSWLQGAWTTVKKDVQQAWTNFIGTITGVGGKILNAVNTNVIKPITDTVGNLVKAALQWGANLMQNFINGIKSKFGDLGNAIKNGFKVVAGWFGFHSPPPNAPEAANWGPNLIKMFAGGVLASTPVLARAASQAFGVLASAAAGGTMGTVAGAGATGVAAFSSLAGVTGRGGGGNTSVTHNWNGAFPNATNRKEIEAAIRSVQQTDYRRARRGGSYGGLRSGIGTTHPY